MYLVMTKRWSGMVWSAGGGAVFGFLGYRVGGNAQEFLLKYLPVYTPGVAALLQKPNFAAPTISNVFGGFVQGGSAFVQSPEDNKRLP